MNNALQPPPPFRFDDSVSNVTSGNITREWSKWKNSFKIYMKAIKLDKETPDVQVNVLLHVAGEKCQEIFEQFNEQFRTAEDLLIKFDGYFGGKKNLTIERHKFFGRNQQDCESMEQYISELNNRRLRGILPRAPTFLQPKIIDKNKIIKSLRKRQNYYITEGSDISPTKNYR
ncbi:hypothetical protein RR48_06881 [Papilio machaon]|uniref:Retrotransposon gag domain-containing protein n=1 Tax=Papilio machaon TaxID=76193 RepID=A0A194RAS5_PAPMA|nr:hypothetical protein RR48_06881 [Papilio machaon]